MTVGYVAAALQQIGVKFTGDEIERRDAVRDARLGAVPGRHGEFLCMVLRPVVKAEARHDFVLPPRSVKSRDGIHPAAQQDDNFHLRDFFFAVCIAFFEAS